MLLTNTCLLKVFSNYHLIKKLFDVERSVWRWREELGVLTMVRILFSGFEQCATDLVLLR